jgi:hypothetical protein
MSNRIKQNSEIKDVIEIATQSKKARSKSRRNNVNKTIDGD